MKKTEFKNLKNKTAGELEKKAKELKLEIIKTKTKITSGQEKNLRKAKNFKKELAQILTVIKEMEIIGSLEKSTKVSKEKKGEEKAKPSSKK